MMLSGGRRRRDNIKFKPNIQLFGGGGNVLGGLVDTITLGATDFSGTKKQQKRMEEELRRQREAEAKKQADEKKKQKEVATNFQESLRQGNLGLLKKSSDQTIG